MYTTFKYIKMFLLYGGLIIKHTIVENVTFETLNEIKDEFHVLLICSSLRSLREKYIKKYYSQKPSVCKVKQLLSTSNTSENV